MGLCSSSANHVPESQQYAVQKQQYTSNINTVQYHHQQHPQPQVVYYQPTQQQTLPYNPALIPADNPAAEGQAAPAITQTVTSQQAAPQPQVVYVMPPPQQEPKPEVIVWNNPNPQYNAQPPARYPDSGIGAGTALAMGAVAGAATGALVADAMVTDALVTDAIEDAIIEDALYDDMW